MCDLFMNMQQVAVIFLAQTKDNQRWDMALREPGSWLHHIVSVNTNMRVSSGYFTRQVSPPLFVYT